MHWGRGHFVSLVALKRVFAAYEVLHAIMIQKTGSVDDSLADVRGMAHDSDDEGGSAGNGRGRKKTDKKDLVRQSALRAFIRELRATNWPGYSFKCVHELGPEGRPPFHKDRFALCQGIICRHLI